MAENLPGRSKKASLLVTCRTSFLPGSVEYRLKACRRSRAFERLSVRRRSAPFSEWFPRLPPDPAAVSSAVRHIVRAAPGHHAGRRSRTAAWPAGAVRMPDRSAATARPTLFFDKYLSLIKHLTTKRLTEPTNEPAPYL
jgi:hypothetical protein